MTRPISIRELICSANAAQAADGVAFLTRREHKGHREAWVLGHFAQLLASSSIDPRWRYALIGDTPAIPADFAIFSDAEGTDWVCDAEICEALNPDRRRGDELKHLTAGGLVAIGGEDGLSGDLYSGVHATVRKKIDNAAHGQQPYRSPTWLVILDNVWGRPPPSRRGVDGVTAAAAQTAQCLRATLEMTGLQQIWVVSGDCATARRAYPSTTDLRRR